MGRETTWICALLTTRQTPQRQTGARTATVGGTAAKLERQVRGGLLLPQWRSDRSTAEDYRRYSLHRLLARPAGRHPSPEVRPGWHELIRCGSGSLAGFGVTPEAPSIPEGVPLLRRSGLHTGSVHGMCLTATITTATMARTISRISNVFQRANRTASNSSLVGNRISIQADCTTES